MTESQLRVIAAGPRLAAEGGTTGLDTLLAMARSDGAHALTVVDCGTLQRDADRLALAAASHVAWVLPATRTGARRRRAPPGPHPPRRPPHRARGRPPCPAHEARRPPTASNARRHAQRAPRAHAARR